MVHKNLAVFASGRGSNFQAILKKISSGWIPASVNLCITNNPAAGVIELAEKHNITVKIDKSESDAGCEGV